MKAVALAMLLLTGLAGPAAAAFIFISEGAEAGVDELACSSAMTGDVPDECSVGIRSASADVAGPFVTGDAFGIAVASYTSIRVKVRASNSSSIPSRSTASASAFVSDALGLNAPDVPLAGRIFWRFRLTGDVLVGPSGDRSYCLDVTLPTASGEYCASNLGTGISTDGGFAFEFNSGALVAELVIPFDNLRAAADAATGQLSLGLTAQVSARDGESLELDLSNTLVVTEISLRDLDGNLIRVPGLTLTSESGFDYPFLNALPQDPGGGDPTAVPDPATFTLLGGALVGLRTLRRRRG